MQNEESRKTAIYVLVAGIALVVAWEPWRPAPPDHGAPTAVGSKMFEKFKDPLASKSLEIMRFNEDTATISPFKVAQVDGVWSIPSHSNYPADAQEHMAEAATALIDLTILGVASESPADQELYGVITPDPKKLRPGMTGVGTRVTLRDDKDKLLADLVIGKEVKDQPSLRYVREADRDPIYVVKVNTGPLSTKFEDWIEEDLLKLNAFDVREVSLNDYSIQEALTPDGVRLQMQPRSKIKLAFDDAKSAWNVVEMNEFNEQGQQVPTKMAEDEELDSTTLNAMKTALDDLKIVDVERKPEGLSHDLSASEEFAKNSEARESLLTKGVYAVPIEGRYELFSSEGEATCTTKDGVRYVLRFGRLAGGTDDGGDAKEGEEPKSDPALNRYLFVMAQFDESQIPKPELQQMPEVGKPAEEKATDKKPGDEKADEAPAEGKADAEKADAPKKDETPPAKEPEAEKVPETKTADQETTSDEQVEDKQAAADTEKTEAAADEPPKSDESAKADEEVPETAPAAPTPEEELRVAIERENKRRQEEYDDAVKKGREKVEDLNNRFADWYFVISDDVYQKIHLGRDSIVKKKEAETPADAVNSLGDPALKELEKGLGAPPTIQP